MRSVLEKLLSQAFEAKASDLHLKANSRAMIRIYGQMKDISEKVFSQEEIKKMCQSILNQNQLEQLSENFDIDAGYSLLNTCRFRVNIYHDINGMGAVFRAIPFQIKSMDEIGLPDIATDLLSREQGLILVTGPTGSGKSTTLAAMVDNINQSQKKHIITIEDPLEYVHQDKMSIINQREVGTDVDSFDNALLSILRQDPDMILVGEMRNLETIKMTLTAAETGKLVIATLHTTNAMQTAERIVNVFPKNQQQQVLTQLSIVIQGIISQTLLLKIDNSGRVAAFEVMVADAAMKNLIKEGKFHQIQSYIEAGKEKGMQTLDMALAELVKKRIIAKNSALDASQNPMQLEQLLDPTRPAITRTRR
ncbi:type IV pilus twitching motility protein PilT [Candidatus Riflebacteria bacterium]